MPRRAPAAMVRANLERGGAMSAAAEAGPALRRIALADRGVLAVAGPDARAFMQGLVTNDVGKVDRARAVYAAMLTPQGKFLFDFVMMDDGEGGLLLDAAAARLEALAKRLAFYRLRARVEIADASAALAVTALVGEGAGRAVRLHEAPGNARRDGEAVFAIDPRLAALGARCLHPRPRPPALAGAEGSLDDYHAHRLALAVPEGGIDVLVEKSFILESNFEELNAVDFEKGCYVGQELTARTKFRGTVRRRLFGVVGEAALPAAGTPVVAGGAAIGELRSARGRRGIALIRTDRLRQAGGGTVRIGEVPAQPVKPAWAAF